MVDLLPGIVVAVSEEFVGTQTSAPATSGAPSSGLTIPFTIPATLPAGSGGGGGATVLTVDDVSMFSPTGGRVTVNGTPVAYTSTDDEASTITLAAPLPAPLEEGAVVLVDPPRVDKTAMVLIDGSSDPIPATVPLNMQDALPVGIREEENREQVRLTPDGQWSWAVFDLDGDLVRDGSYIDPETLPLPDEVVVDAPTVSPLPNVYGAFGALVVSWEAPTNVAVDIYVSTSLPVPTTGTPAASVTGGGVGLQWIRSLADGTPVAPGTTYWVALVARNESGAAPVSEPASGTPALVGDADVNVTASMLIANLALVEALAAVTVHVTGEATLQSLTALGKVALRDPENELGQGATLYLRGGTTAPVTSATVTQGWDSVAAGSSVDRMWRHGGVWHDGRLYYTVSVSGSSNIQSVSPAGTTALWAGPTQLGGGSFDARGITRLGSNWYVLGRDYNLDGNWRVRILNSSFVKVGEFHAFSWTIPYDPAIGNDGTNLLLARTWGSGDVHFRYVTTAGDLLDDVTTPIVTSADLSSIHRGAFDYGTIRTVISTRDRSGGDVVYVLNASNVRQTGDEWTLADSRVAALAWDGANFRHLSRSSEKMWTYAADLSTTRRWVSAAWNSGTTATTQGPKASYLPSKRKRAAFTFPPLPGGASGLSVYVGSGTTEPARTSMWRQTVNHPSSQYTMSGPPVTTGTNPQDTSTYPGGSPARIRTDSGHGLDSTGALHVRTLIVDEP